jgi:hypothetical protein
MKIDVEGFELAVAGGRRGDHRRCRPVLYVENDRPEKSAALIEWLWSGSTGSGGIPRRCSIRQFLRQFARRVSAVVSINMLCLPREAEIRSTVCARSSSTGIRSRRAPA